MGSFGVMCDNEVPSGAWMSNITGRRMPTPSGADFARVSLSWQPDPEIESEERAYRVVLRNVDREGANFSIETNVSNDFLLLHAHNNSSMAC